MLTTKEHYNMMEVFERSNKHLRLSREKNKDMWKSGNVYEDGKTNELFISYRNGYALAKHLFESSTIG